MCLLLLLLVRGNIEGVGGGRGYVYTRVPARVYRPCIDEEEAGEKSRTRRKEFEVDIH